MTPEALADLHARCFGTAPRPWSAAEFSDLLALPTTLLEADPDGRAFALARRAGPEIEILTICTDPAARREGRAARLLATVEDTARGLGASEAFLEVGETNLPARALYATAGYVPAGFRKDYYQGPAGARAMALVLRKPL